jgi:hypothetical protein
MRAITAREHKHAIEERRQARDADQERRRATVQEELDRRRALRVLDLSAEEPQRTPVDERERQRVEHLVLGRARPAGRSVGKGRAKRKEPVKLKPAIDQALKLREDWSHKQGTPETHAHAAITRENPLARLYMAGGIDAEQLASAVAIAEAAEKLGAEVAVRTASLEARVDSTRVGDGTFYEALGQVRREMAYRRWCKQVRGPLSAVLDMITGDAVGFTVVARRYRMHNRRAKQLLIDALDLWPQLLSEVRREIDPATLAAAQAGLG